jgi:hypothetical protein
MAIMSAPAPFPESLDALARISFRFSSLSFHLDARLVAVREYDASLFKGHPYGRQGGGDWRRLSGFKAPDGADRDASPMG